MSVRLPLMQQSWHHLLFLHWEVPAAALAALVPPALTIDTYEGRAYVALVPFSISGVRLRGLPALPFASEFHEVNVRTYVHRHGQDPGVWFFSLDAASRLAVAGARALYRLPYHYACIRLSLVEVSTPVVDYDAARAGSPGSAGCRVRYQPQGPAAPAAAGTLEHFLVERYLLYAARGPALWRARVRHAPYRLAPAGISGLSESMLAAAGVVRPEGAPLAHYAEQVDVEVFAPERVPRSG